MYNDDSPKIDNNVTLVETVEPDREMGRVQKRELREGERNRERKRWEREKSGARKRWERKRVSIFSFLRMP